MFAQMVGRPMRETDAEEITDTGHADVDALDAWAMIESSPDGMLLTDEHGRILVANTRIEALFGYERCELVGRPVEDLIPERHRQPHLTHRTRYRAAPTVRPMGEGLGLYGLRQDGTEFPIEVSLSPIDRDGRLRVVATVRDISSRLALDAHVHAVLDTVDAATDGVFMFDPETFRFEYVNQGAVKQLRYSETELLAMTPLHIKPEFDRASFSRLMEPLLTGAVSSRTFTTKHRRKDGTEVAVEIILEYPAARRPGDRRMLVALVRDISERLAADLEYRKTVEAFKAAFDLAPVPVSLATIDRNGVHLSSINEAYCRLLGYEAGELVGRNVADLVVETDRPRVGEVARKVLGGEAAMDSLETRLVRADGSTVPVWAHSSILDADPGETITVLTHVIDLTDRKRIEGEQERARLWTESQAKVRAAVLDELPFDEILNLVCHRARLLTGADVAFVVSADPDGTRHRVIAGDPPGSGRLLPDSVALGEPAGRALAGEPSRVSGFDAIDSAEPDGRDSNETRPDTTLSGIVVRIDTTPEPVLLYVLDDEPDMFDASRIAMAEALAAEAATALELTQARQERSRLALLEDRERLAHDFHDLVIQRLFAAGMSLQSVQSLTDDREISNRVGQVIDEIDNAISELRSVIFRLTADPPMTPASRLASVVVQAREWLGFEPTLRFEGESDVIAHPVLEQMIPTLTEMLSNVARHAEAGDVDVLVATDDDQITLRVIDNGTGFDPDMVDRSGLANLAARAQRLGGGCTVDTEPGCGTTITWTVPY